MPERITQIAIHAKAEDVRPASAWLEESCHAWGIPAKTAMRLDLCLNEALANIIDHAGEAAALAPVLLEFDASEEPTQVVLSVSYQGPSFNPVTAETKSGAQTLTEATPGGLGLDIMKGCSDQMEYGFRNGRNHIAFTMFGGPVQQ